MLFDLTNLSKKRHRKMRPKIRLRHASVVVHAMEPLSSKYGAAIRTTLTILIIQRIQKASAAPLIHIFVGRTLAANRLQEMMLRNIPLSGGGCLMVLYMI